MELQQGRTEKEENKLELADRKSLFQLLFFLDEQPPQSCAVKLKYLFFLPEFTTDQRLFCLDSYVCYCSTISR